MLWSCCNCFVLPNSAAELLKLQSYSTVLRSCWNHSPTSQCCGAVETAVLLYSTVLWSCWNCSPTPQCCGAVVMTLSYITVFCGAVITVLTYSTVLWSCRNYTVLHLWSYWNCKVLLHNAVELLKLYCPIPQCRGAVETVLSYSTGLCSCWNCTVLIHSVVELLKLYCPNPQCHGAVKTALSYSAVLRSFYYSNCILPLHCFEVL